MKIRFFLRPHISIFNWSKTKRITDTMPRIDEVTTSAWSLFILSTALRRSSLTFGPPTEVAGIPSKIQKGFWPRNGARALHAKRRNFRFYLNRFITIVETFDLAKNSTNVTEIYGRATRRLRDFLRRKHQRLICQRCLILLRQLVFQSPNIFFNDHRAPSSSFPSYEHETISFFSVM